MLTILTYLRKFYVTDLHCLNAVSIITKYLFVTLSLFRHLFSEGQFDFIY